MMNDTAIIKKLDQAILKAREVHAQIIREEKDGNDLDLTMLNLLVDLMNWKAEIDQPKTTVESSPKHSETPRHEIPSAMENSADQAKNRIPQWKNNQSQLTQ